MTTRNRRPSDHASARPRADDLAAVEHLLTASELAARRRRRSAARRSSSPRAIGTLVGVAGLEVCCDIRAASLRRRRRRVARSRARPRARRRASSPTREARGIRRALSADDDGRALLPELRLRDASTRDAVPEEVRATARVHERVPGVGDRSCACAPCSRRMPMRYALISDIHANLPALEAVLADIARAPDIDATYHLGDLVGYAPWPNETVARAASSARIAGHRRELRLDGRDSTTSTAAASTRIRGRRSCRIVSFEWTKAARLARDEACCSAALPFRLDLARSAGTSPGPTVILVHGTPTLNTLYWTEDRPDAFCLRWRDDRRREGGRRDRVRPHAQAVAPRGRGRPLREYGQRGAAEGRRLARRLRAARRRRRAARRRVRARRVRCRAHARRRDPRERAAGRFRRATCETGGKLRRRPARRRRAEYARVATSRKRSAPSCWWLIGPGAVMVTPHRPARSGTRASRSPSGSSSRVIFAVGHISRRAHQSGGHIGFWSVRRFRARRVRPTSSRSASGDRGLGCAACWCSAPVGDWARRCPRRVRHRGQRARSSSNGSSRSR